MRRKIVLPFTLLFLAGFGALIGVALWESARSVEQRVVAEVRSLVGLFSRRPEMLENQPTIDQVQQALSAVSVLYGVAADSDSWKPNSSSSGTHPHLLEEFGWQRPYLEGEMKRIHVDGVYYNVACVAVAGDFRAYAVYKEDALEEQKLAAMKPLIYVSVAGLALVTLVGFWIAANLTAPLGALVARTEALARGDLEQKVEVVSRDEIGRLAQAFNLMLDALRKSQDERVRAEKLAALGQVTAGIAHEIRNPLTAMKMTLQLLLRDEPGGERRESISIVLKETERLQMAIDGLLAYARPPTLTLTPGDLNAVARGAAEVLDAQVKHLGVALELRLEYVPLVRLDAPRMHQVVVNLLLNAIQATGTGGHVTMSTAAQGEKVTLSVTDSGAGIAAEARARIFEPFFTTKTGGIGLGLAVSKRAVEEHGGTIRFDGTPGKTTFTVELPIPKA